MLDEIRRARTLRSLRLGTRRLLSQQGEMNGLSVARSLVDQLQQLDDEALHAFFDFLARELSPDPQRVLKLAQAYADAPHAQALIALTQGVEPPRQEWLRRLNRAPGGTAAILRLRRALLRVLPRQGELHALEADLLHLLSSWFNPGFLQMRRVDWNAPAQLLEKLIQHEAVHAIDGWDDLRRRLQPDRRCFAFFHPQLPDEPLIFVEVALLPEMPATIAPLMDKAADAAAARALARGGVLRHQQLRARAARRVAGQLPDQERGTAAAARAAAHQDLLHAVAHSGAGGLAAVGPRLRGAAAPEEEPGAGAAAGARAVAPCRSLRARSPTPSSTPRCSS
jgi:hypothetical protein